jgi:hypothetical protein
MSEENQALQRQLLLKQELENFRVCKPSQSFAVKIFFVLVLFN